MSDSGASPAPPDGSSPAAAAANNPPHFKVGLGFVKAYYKTLTENPEMLVNFYKAGTSFLGHGEGSTVADPKPLEEYDLAIQQRWGCSSNETMRFDFEHGAIDTQPAVNGGVLLVVTAQVFFEEDGSAAKASESKSFVQTFFLAREGRNFACYNDVLRFLQFPESKGKAPPSTPTADVGVVTEPQEQKKVADKTYSVHPEAEISSEATPALTDEAPGGGVEESKVEAPEEDEEEVAPAVPVVPTNGKDGRGKRGKGGKSQQQPQQKQQPASTPAPGSWASLVATGGSAPNTPSRKSAAEKPAEAAAATADAPAPPKEKTGAKAPAPAVTKPNQEDAAAAASKPAKGKAAPPKKPFMDRDPDKTLVIKNVTGNMEKSDLQTMFGPFAAQTNSKVLGVSPQLHRNLAFVDYDSAAPVLAAVAKHKETPFQWNGKVLEVDQKSQEIKSRRNGGYRNNTSSGGGGREYRRGGDRGGGRRSGRGGASRGGR
ncbi:MAG: hypothetical protein SGILL_005052 [Bacillariaceae sp.]